MNEIWSFESSKAVVVMVNVNYIKVQGEGEDEAIYVHFKSGHFLVLDEPKDVAGFKANYFEEDRDSGNS